MMTLDSPATPAPTFRDPAGSLRLEDDYAVRTVHPAARAAALEFINSPLYIRLQLRGDVLGTTVEDTPEGLRLLHPRVAVPTYPWEWTPSQWLAAAELTLDLCAEAISSGWILKDATPLNILFIGPRPVLVDVLSFERRNPASSIWLAYGQYVRTFLLPLVMNQLQGWPLALSVFRRDGYEPAELYAAMGWRQRLSRAAFWPVTLPTLLEQRNGGAAAPPQPTGNLDADASAHVLQRTLAALRKRTQRAMPAAASSNWSDYTGTLTHYTAAESAAKHEWVQQVLEDLQPQRVLDIGANTGEFSALAASLGATVTALERDGVAADRLYRMVRDRGLDVQTIHADLARPTPAVGWRNAEQTSLLARLGSAVGQHDVVLMLAVIHHLVLMEQVPLAAIVELCHGLTRRHLVIEWVPATDTMYVSLMRGRDELYGSLSESDLMAACAGKFKLVQRLALANGRVLLLLHKLPDRLSA